MQISLFRYCRPGLELNIATKGKIDSLPSFERPSLDGKLGMRTFDKIGGLEEPHKPSNKTTVSEKLST